MSDDPVRTRVRTAAGWLDFQRYFVEQQCRPEVTEFSYGGAPTAKAHPDFVAALAHPELRAVVICPSNPFISIEPILTVPGVREALLACAAPVVAVAPIVGDQAIKGPTAKMMRELGLRISAETVAQRYADILDGYVVDDSDAPLLATFPIPAIAAKAVMVSLADREQLAKMTLALADDISRRHPQAAVIKK
jgi:LPPG:FO 2-phospho-L-lactate transferase